MLETSGRLLALLSLLQARRDWPGALLADRLGVSPRTVRRDVDRLRELGYPVSAVKGPDGGYRLAPGADLPPLLFDDEQAVAVAVALQTADVPGTEEAALRALATIRQVMPARLRARLDALYVTHVRRGREQPAVDPDVLVALGTAVRAREVLRFDYDGGSSPLVGAGDAAFRPPRRVEPHHVVASEGRWYLVGFDLDRADWRTFRADRITLRSGAGPRFVPRQVPGGDVATFVAERFGPTGAALATDAVRGEAVLHARAEVMSRWVGPGGTCEPLPAVDGEPRCRVVMGSWSWVGLAGRLGMFDVPFDVVGPPELVEAVATLGGRCAASAPGVTR